jgi:hypothetical protein
MRHPNPSANFRYKLSTKFRFAISTNFRHTISTDARYGVSTTLWHRLSTKFQHDLSIKFRKGEFPECGHGRLATRRKVYFCGFNGEWMLLRRMSGLAV